MTDLIKCYGGLCPQKFKCQRFSTVRTSGTENFYRGIPYDPILLTCKEFVGKSVGKYFSDKEFIGDDGDLI